MSTGTHFVEKCKEHDTVTAQCRCPAPDKTVRLIDCPGPPRCFGAQRESVYDIVQRQADDAMLWRPINTTDYERKLQVALREVHRQVEVEHNAKKK